MSVIAILLIKCSVYASEISEQDLILSLFYAEKHRCLFLDEINEAPKEKLVLFTLGPGGGNFYGQYLDAMKMQKVPNYFLNLAEAFPSTSAKIYAIDPSFSIDCTAPEYAFLYEDGWELVTNLTDIPQAPIRFVKGNTEIVFFKFIIPDRYEGELSKAVAHYTSSVLDSGGCVFMGHHGSAFGVFPVFANAYSLMQKQHKRANNFLMYICAGNAPPWSSPKVYHNIPYQRDELNMSYEKLTPFFEMWIPYPKGEEWEQLSWKQQQHILEEYQEGFNPSYQVYHDLSSLDVNVDIIDGNFHINR